jgi:hypothetical protein
LVADLRAGKAVEGAEKRGKDSEERVGKKRGT